MIKQRRLRVTRQNSSRVNRQKSLRVNKLKNWRVSLNIFRMSRLLSKQKGRK